MVLEKQITVLGWKMRLSLLTITKLNLSLLLIISTFLFSANSAANEQLPYYNSQEFTPHWIDDSSQQLDSFHQIPEFEFIDQDGQTITEKTFEDKIYVAGFFFSTCPGICPAIRSKLSKVQETFLNDPDVKILQHSIRPSTDTVTTLKNYANKNGIKSGIWHLVTGEKQQIYQLAKEAYFASEDLGNLQNTDDFLHTESLLLIDNNRRIRGIYNGLNKASVNYLIADIKTLKSGS